jgi:hypothetical protein
MIEDSIWYRKVGTFRQFLKDVADKNLTIPDVLYEWREQSVIPKEFKTMTVQELLNNPRQIEQLYHALRRMPSEKKFKFPYNKKERERELIELLAQDYNIMTDKARVKIVPGYYQYGDIAFSFGLEVAMAPFNDGNDKKAGELEFIGNINSGMHIIDDGFGFFSGGNFRWTTKSGNYKHASSVIEILSKCGFNPDENMSKRKFHSVLYLNLMTPVPDWSGGAGKTSIELSPYTETIAKTVSSLAYKMPSYHGHGYNAVPIHIGVIPAQIAQDYYLNFLRERYRAIQENPSLKTTDRITQSGVWYRVHKEMVRKKFIPRKDWGTTRESLTNRISEFCEYLSKYEWGETVTREDLGIIASSRAIMYFDGHEYPVGKDNISTLANAKTTDIIVIEKEGMADALKELTDEYHIALVFTRGRFVDYVVELIETAVSKRIPIKVWTLTDYDVDGMEIASAVDKFNVPRIGIDRNTVMWLQKNGYPELELSGDSGVEEEHYAKDAEQRTKDEYLWSKRIEIDSIHSEVGAKGLWKYIIHQIKTLAKEGRDYTDIISRPEPQHLYPEEVNELLDYLSNFFDGLIDEEYAKTESELSDVKNKVLKIDNKKTFIRKQLKEDIVNKDKSPDVKTIIEKIQSLLKSGELPKPKDGFVSEATIKRQKEESEREDKEAESNDDEDDDETRNKEDK